MTTFVVTGSTAIEQNDGTTIGTGAATSLREAIIGGNAKFDLTTSRSIFAQRTPIRASIGHWEDSGATAIGHHDRNRTGNDPYQTPSSTRCAFRSQRTSDPRLRDRVLGRAHSGNLKPGPTSACRGQTHFGAGRRRHRNQRCDHRPSIARE